VSVGRSLVVHLTGRTWQSRPRIRSTGCTNARPLDVANAVLLVLSSGARADRAGLLPPHRLSCAADPTPTTWPRRCATAGAVAAAVASGDSGGPILLDRTILGVNSFVTNGQCAGVTYAYRIDPPEALAFIRSVIAEHG
jgi:hypothetical protein